MRTVRIVMENSPLEDRPTSLCGYCSIVPYHAPMTYDSLCEGVVVYFPTESYESSNQILDRLTRASEMIDASTEPGASITQPFARISLGMEQG
jgi:hypothetical protein